MVIPENSDIKYGTANRIRTEAKLVIRKKCKHEESLKAADDICDFMVGNQKLNMGMEVKFIEKEVRVQICFKCHLVSAVALA